MLGEYTSAGALIREYVYFNGRPLAQVEDVSSSDEITYFHVDHLGTPRVGTDDTGASVWSWSYLGNAFGDIAPSGSVTVNLRMAGQYFDSESDLFYNWNRYYDPATGRYVSSDPIGLGGGLNTFAYAGANPAIYIDPEGLEMAGTMDGPLSWDDIIRRGKTGLKVGSKTIPITRLLNCAYDIGMVGTIAVLQPDMLDDLDWQEILTGFPSQADPGEEAGDNKAEPVPAEEQNTGTGGDGEEPPEDEKEPKDSGKNGQHGDDGRALTKAEKQIKELEEQLENATGKTEKKKIKQKIKNIIEDAYKKRRGENHSQRSKR